MSQSNEDGLTEGQLRGLTERAAREQRKAARAERVASLSEAAAERRGYEDETVAEAEAILSKRATRRALNRSRTEEQGSLDLIEQARNVMRDVTFALSGEVIRLRRELLKTRRQLRAVTTQRTSLVNRLRTTTKSLAKNGLKIDRRGKVVKVDPTSERVKPAERSMIRRLYDGATLDGVRPAEAST